jgi:hypothetical protein
MSIKAPIRHAVSTLWGKPASLLMLAVAAAMRSKPLIRPIKPTTF